MAIFGSVLLHILTPPPHMHYDMNCIKMHLTAYKSAFDMNFIKKNIKNLPKIMFLFELYKSLSIQRLNQGLLDKLPVNFLACHFK